SPHLRGREEPLRRASRPTAAGVKEAPPRGDLFASSFPRSHRGCEGGIAVDEHRRFLTLAGLVALVGVLVGAIWVLGAEPPPLGVCRLPDGSVLRLEAVTVG